MYITSEKRYEPGERIICIISANTDLIRGGEYKVISHDMRGLKIESDDDNEYIGYDLYNPARFISQSEIRDSKINEILKNE
jgi:hypothetical protein